MDPIRRLQKEWKDKARLLPAPHRADFEALWRRARVHAESLYYAWRPVTLTEVYELLLRDPALEMRDLIESLAQAGPSATRGALT